MPRPEKITEIEIALAPGFMVGQVIELAGEPLIIVGIVNRIGGFTGTTKLRVAQPHWGWRLRYKAKRFFRRVWRIITEPIRRLRERTRGG